MIVPQVVDITVWPWAQWDGTFLFRNPDGTLPDVTGWAWRWQMRTEPGVTLASIDVVPVPYIEPGQVLPSGALVTLTAAQTASLYGVGLPDKFYYWLQATLISGVPYDAAKGLARIDPGGVR